MSIADNIRRIRSASGLNQEEFGKIAGVSSMAVSQWENGRAVPRMGAVQKIADHFHISKGEVIDEESDRRSLPPSAIPVRGTSAMVPVRVLGRTHAGERMDEDESDYEAEFPEGVYARVNVTPQTDDELILALSEATPLLQEGMGSPTNACFATWVGSHELVREAFGEQDRHASTAQRPHLGGEN